MGLTLATDTVRAAKPLEKPHKREPQREPLTTEQQELVTRHIGMVERLAKPLAKRWPKDRDELYSVAQLALVESARFFDLARELQFLEYAYIHITGALKTFQLSLLPCGWRDDPKHAPESMSLLLSDEQHGRVLNTEPDPPIGAELESREFVEHAFRVLPAVQTEVCRQLYFCGSTVRAAAEAVGTSKSQLDRLHNEALSRIRDSLSYRAGAND